MRNKIITLLAAFLSLGPSPNLLRIETGKKFLRWTAVKEFEIQRRYLRWCLPIKEGFLGQQVLEKDEKEYKLFICDASGKEIRHGVVKNGQGPEEIIGIVPETLMLSGDGRSVSFYDGGYYLKSLDLASLRIRTIKKISNSIKTYGGRYYIGRQGTTSLETNNDLTVTSFESTAFFSDHVYYLVAYRGLLDEFRVIASLKKEIPPWLKEDYYVKKQSFMVDYYQRLRWARLFSVDWKRDMIYVIPDIETPEIESVGFNGRKTRLRLDINPKKYQIGLSEFESYFSWYDNNLSQMLKNTLHYEFRLPLHAPALQGIKVIGDWLLIITGNRDWDRQENEVLVFLLPSLQYQGSFRIPFPNAPDLTLKWEAGYFSTHILVEHEDDYNSRHQIFRYRIQ